jgi:hypothetical protein
MNIQKIVSTILLACMLTPRVALAQGAPSPDPDPPTIVKEPLPSPSLLPGEKDPGAAISPMKKGQRAPFTGVLLSPEASANVIVEFETFQERMRLEVDKAIKQEQADCQKKVSDLDAKSVADKKILKANVDEKGRTITNLNAEIKKLKDEKATEWAPTTWMGIGTAGGILLTVLTAFAISKATQ